MKNGSKPRSEVGIGSNSFGLGEDIMREEREYNIVAKGRTSGVIPTSDLFRFGVSKQGSVT
jgi:hypothetical protein